jgi:hypothetical protein
VYNKVNNTQLRKYFIYAAVKLYRSSESTIFFLVGRGWGWVGVHDVLHEEVARLVHPSSSTYF